MALRDRWSRFLCASFNLRT